MIFKNSLESLEETPLTIQRTLTQLNEIKQQNEEYTRQISELPKGISTKSNPRVTKENIKNINKAFLKTYESERQSLNLLENLLDFLDGQVKIFEDEISEFEEGCAISAMQMRADSFNEAFETTENSKYCYCRKESKGNMVACDAVGCPIEWFHYDCVGLAEPPIGKWICEDCKIRRSK